ncbi:MAG: hypothetical protein WA801_17045, partial [Pseudolabrys sp.]
TKGDIHSTRTPRCRKPLQLDAIGTESERVYVSERILVDLEGYQYGKGRKSCASKEIADSNRAGKFHRGGIAA